MEKYPSLARVPALFLWALGPFWPLGTRQTQLLHVFSGSPAAEQLQDILGEEDEAPNPTLFTEMDTLQHDGDQMEWKESAR
jgi:hypothetical protein